MTQAWRDLSAIARLCANNWRQFVIASDQAVISFGLSQRPQPCILGAQRDR